MSETAVCRNRLSVYCKGNGVDLGYGGDPIVPTAITVDMSLPYVKYDNHPQNLSGDARNLYWFKDGVLDYVYSSHLLEDFPREETKGILIEWLRVLKSGGHLVLYLPHELRYREHCSKTGQPYNGAHKIEEMSLDYIRKIVLEIGNVDIVHERDRSETYSFDIVVRKK